MLTAVAQELGWKQHGKDLFCPQDMAGGDSDIRILVRNHLPRPAFTCPAPSASPVPKHAAGVFQFHSYLHECPLTLQWFRFILIRLSSR